MGKIEIFNIRILRTKDQSILLNLRDNCYKKLLLARINSRIKKNKNTSNFRKLKLNISRINTILIEITKK